MLYYHATHRTGRMKCDLGSRRFCLPSGCRCWYSDGWGLPGDGPGGESFTGGAELERSAG
eukprot:scaffold35124_cov38-Prasinocladus_malaysianus.AAC.1